MPDKSVTQFPPDGTDGDTVAKRYPFIHKLRRIYEAQETIAECERLIASSERISELRWLRPWLEKHIAKQRETLQLLRDREGTTP